MYQFDKHLSVEPEVWNRQVKQLKGSVFHRYEWIRYLEHQNNAMPVYFQLKNEAGISNCLAIGMMNMRKVFGIHTLKSLTFGSFPAHINREMLVKMVEFILEYADTENVSELKIHSFGTPINTDIMASFNFSTKKRWEFLLNLPSSEELFWNKIHSKKRNLIRKAKKEDVQVILSENGQDIFHLRTLALETQKRKKQKGIAFAVASETYYRNLKNYVLDSGLGQLYLAVHQGNAVAGSFFVSDGESVYYLLSAANSLGLKKAAPDLILWTAMTDCIKRGIAVFNLGGVSEDDTGGVPVEESGLYHFKKRFGAEAYRCYQGKLILRPLLHRLYQLQKAVKPRLALH